MDEQLKFLKNAVDAIEKNRANYSHIKDGELASRRRFIEQSSSTVQSNVQSNIIFFHSVILYLSIHRC